jgi:hypothetical protein
LLFWIVALVLGIAQTWGMRHEVISDGISYIEIAQHYAQGDWHNAINAYWSPLFSWVIAALLFCFRIAPYWHVATLHLVVLIAYLTSLAAFEWLLRELLRSEELDTAGEPMAPIVVYAIGYSLILFAGLSMVGMFYPSPDMISLALTLALYALLLRISRSGGGVRSFLSFGLLCALLYLDRAAFAPLVFLCIAVVLVCLRLKQLPLMKPALLMIGTTLILTLPFVAAMSAKYHHLTLGDAGKLNYAWELDGAHRWIHWQGEPGDIGTPLHPTHLAVSSPKTFVFDKPIDATYPPWYDPAYWYAGVAPRVHVAQQLRAVAVNTSVILNLLLRSPVLVPVFLLALLAGFGGWLRRLLHLWPVLVPAIAGLGLYSLVYVERRYVAANFLAIWMAFVVALRFKRPELRRWASSLLVVLALLFLGVYVGTRLRGFVRDGFVDLWHGNEKYWNTNFVLASRLKDLGLCPGDKVAYIGPGINAEWARLAQAKIVAEVPLMYARTASFMNNLHVDDTREIETFFKGSPEMQQHVLDTFRSAGAVMAVTDGYFSYGLSNSWSRIIPADEKHVPRFDKGVWSQLNSRYIWLGPKQTSGCSSPLANRP